MHEKQIQNGVEFLNKNFPHWICSVDISQLNMIDTEFCILGQSCEDYYETTRKFNLSEDDECNLGFNLPTREDDNWELDDERYERLTHEWKMKIYELRSKT